MNDEPDWIKILRDIGVLLTVIAVGVWLVAALVGAAVLKQWGWF
jgi:hypothetical protein